jgi:hypothetical protein
MEDPPTSEVVLVFLRTKTIAINQFMYRIYGYGFDQLILISSNI